MRSMPLRLQLVGGVGAQVVGLGGEADEHLAGAPAGAELGEDVGGGLEDDLGRAAGLLDLAGRRRRTGRKSATAAAITTTSAPSARLSTACSISAAVSTRTTSMPTRHGQADGGDERDLGAAGGGLLGDGVALLARASGCR